MIRNDVIARLHTFIEENFLYMRPDFQLGENDSLLGKGIVDSMGVMEMIDFLGTEFGVTVADSDITEENLGTLSAIASYVTKHAAAETRQIA